MSKLLARLNEFWLELRRGNISTQLARHGDLLLPIALMLVLGTLIVPLPTFIISMLVVLNLAISFVILLTSLYISTPTQLTSYPTILLLTTLFRLCLSVSVSRSILSTGSAGDVIEMLGKIPGGGEIIVGGVVFLMILVVQFIVVAKGSERVGEVKARFTLDALPGKQMAIDADMRSGLITQEEARQARHAITQESQLCGALDGAMQYVKGDSIATIIIAMINIVAGLAIGIFQKGMPIAAAARTYTILTIGDGLSAIIASMLITVSAGIIITRVASDDVKSNVGSDISQQLLRTPKPLMLAAGLFAGLALVLALMGTWASIPLFVVGAAIGGLAYSLHRAQKAAALEEAERAAQSGEAGAQDELQPTYAMPLAVAVSTALTPLIDTRTESGARFRASLPELRSAIYYQLGVMLPSIVVVGDVKPLKPDQYFIAIKQVPVAYGTTRDDCVFVNDSAENISIFGLDGEDMCNPADQSPGAWIPAAQRERAEDAGLQVWEPAEVIRLHLAHVLRKHAHEFLGIQEAQGLLDFAARGMPKLVEEVISKVVTIDQFTDVLQRLVQEDISIHDIKSILDALSEHGRSVKDTVMLTERVRSAMKRYLCFKYTGGRNTLYYYELGQDIEDIIREKVRRVSTASPSLGLDPVVVQSILAALRRELGDLPPTAQKPVLVTEKELRRHVRNLIEVELPNVAVLSYDELTPDLNQQPIKCIRISAEQQDFFPDAEAMRAALP